MTRRCNRCQFDLPIEQFYWRSKTLGKRAYTCKPCQRQYGAEWRAKQSPIALRNSRRRIVARLVRENRQRLFDHLQGASCLDCGYDDVRALDFDHVRGKKRAGVWTMAGRSYSWHLIEVEISKCEVVCRNCHAIRTASRGGFTGPKYGSPFDLPPALRRFSSETKRKMSEQRRGKKCTDVAVASRAAALRGHVVTEQTRHAIGAKARARYEQRRIIADSQGKRLGRGGKII